MEATAASTATVSMTISSDPAGGHGASRQQNGSSSKKNSSSSSKTKSNNWFLSFFGQLCRFIFIDMTLMILFALLVATMVIHQIHDDYLYPQLKLMYFQKDNLRPYMETTYYHRYCNEDDFTAKTVPELVIQSNYTTKDCTEHMLTHGVSVYPNLVSNQTASVLREWIVKENHNIQNQWGVIQNKNRYSWGIDMNMHPTLQTFWKELVSHQQFVNALQSIVGTDPAIIEFTAITSTYGATDQHDHADVVPPGSATKFARSFVPSYSLFIPLQDTTYEMGATHVCPGSHVCSAGADDNCPKANVAMSGPKEEGGAWKMGWGALLNQQMYHKGMGFTQEGAPDRVVLIATFTSRPNYRHGVETRMIGQGGSYSLVWHQWGHTFSDYVHADKRMTEPQKTLRSLGIIKGNGITYISSASMRMAAEDSGMTTDDLEELFDEGGYSFLPMAWQGSFDETSDINDWHAFLLGTLKKTEKELKRINIIATGVYIALVVIWDLVAARFFKRASGSLTSRCLIRILVTHSVIIFVACMIVREVQNSNWGKTIQSGKAYRIPWNDSDNDDQLPSTLPYKTDILFTQHYASDYFASYSRVIDYAHPGNRYWRLAMEKYAPGYAILPSPFQEKFCSSLVHWATRYRRFLKQGTDRFWVSVVDEDELVKYCQKQLIMASNGLSDVLLRQIDALQSETQFGLFRNTDLHENAIPKMLDDWEKRILESFASATQQSMNNETKSPTRTSIQSQSLLTPKQLSSITHLIPPPTRKSTTIHHQKRNVLPPSPKRREPFANAWLEEGEKVYARYKCEGEWHPGVISTAIPNEAAFDIDYDDGDEDTSLDRECVKRA